MSRTQRALLGLLAALLLLVGLEIVLRVAGFGYSTRFFVSASQGEALIPNRAFAWRFISRDVATQPYPVLVRRRKPPGALRVFVLGESAAQGTPSPTFGAARILEVMLRRQFPARHVEVINVAMRGINSHAIVPIARECARLEPDLFLVYMGNNEAIGIHSPEPGSWRWLRQPWILRRIDWAKSTKLAQLIETGARALKRTPLRRTQDMEFFRKQRLTADDPCREPIYWNFRQNLDDICRITRNSGAKTVVATVAVNLKDFPPLASLHRRGLTAEERSRWETLVAQGTKAEAGGQFAEALTNYLAAEQIDPAFAELHFRLGRCALAAGAVDLGKKHFGLARDRDALQFRTDSRLNSLIRERVTSRTDSNVVLADIEKAFADNPESEHGLPGARLFHEHVHLTFDGDYLLAKTLLPIVAGQLEGRLSSLSEGRATRAGRAAIETNRSRSSAATFSNGTPAGELADPSDLAGTPRPGTGRGLEKPGAAPPALPSRAECAAELAFSPWDEVSVVAAMVRSQTRPPFLDQLEHRERQARAEAMVQQRLREFQQQDGLARSREIYRHAVAKRPDDWQIRFNHGMMLAEFKRPAEAAEEFAAAVRVMPVFLPMRISLGQALWDTGRRLEAAAQFHEALRIDPNYAPAKDALRQVAVATGRR